MNSRSATLFDHRVHLTQTLGWSDDARAKQYMQELKKRADPICHARGWCVGEMKEFYPRNEQLLGLNVDFGVEILIRFRHPSDRNVFLPMQTILGTMLHELVHCKIAPHDDSFWALYHELARAEAGKAGTNGSGGHRLGGRLRPMPRDTSAGSKRPPHPLELRNGGLIGRRLGGGEGAASTRGLSMSEVMAAAALRRQSAQLPPTRGGHGDDDELELLGEDEIAHQALGGCCQSIYPDKHARTLLSPEDTSGTPPAAVSTTAGADAATSTPVVAGGTAGTGIVGTASGAGANGLDIAEPRTDDATSLRHRRDPAEDNVPAGAWECKRCHFHNHALLFPVCEMCSDDVGSEVLQFLARGS